MPTNLRTPLDPDVAKVMDAAIERPLAAGDAGPDAVREQVREFADWLRGSPFPTLADVAVSDELISGPGSVSIPVRWYGAIRGTDDDVVVYIHGGGWTAGSVDAYDLDVRLMHQLTGLTIASVEYRRTPEYAFPTPLEDCVAVVRALAARSPRTLSIAGDSAGGNLSLGAALTVRKEQLLNTMLLIYPVVDPDAFENRSYLENGSGYLLERDDMRRFWRMYAPDIGEQAHPLAAPSRADLRGLPPAVVVSAGYDPLLDEDRELASRLIEADVPVTHLPNPSLTHGFQQMTPRVPAATVAVEAMYAAFASMIRQIPR